jgi:hypothetical protein
MLRTGVDAPIEIIMAEIPRLPGVDRSAAASARREAGCYLTRETSAELLMPPAVTASMRLTFARHALTPLNTGREILTAAGSGAVFPKKVHVSENTVSSKPVLATL